MFESFLVFAALHATPALRLEEAGRVLARGDESGAVRVLQDLSSMEGEIGRDASLAYGRLLLEKGQPESALPHLTRVREAGDALADWARLFEATALRDAGEASRALALLQPLDFSGGDAAAVPTPADIESVLLRADLLSGSGQPRRAASDYSVFLAHAGQHPELRRAAFAHAESLEAAGAHQKAVDAYWTIWWEDPGSPHAEESHDRAKRLAAAHQKAGLPAATPPEVLRHAQRLRRVGRGPLAAEELAKLEGTLTGDDRREAIFERAGALYASWKNEESLAAIEELLKDPGEYRCEAEALRARLFWVRLPGRGDPESHAQRQSESCPWSAEDGREGGEEGAWILANLRLRRGERKEAEPLLRRLSMEKNRRSEAAAWKLGLSLYEEGRFGEAATIFEQMAESTDSRGYLQAALYWAARARFQDPSEQSRESSEQRLTELCGRHRFSYYGLRAEQTFGALYEKSCRNAVPGFEGTALQASGGWQAQPGYQRALRLERAGLADLAGREYLALAGDSDEIPESLLLRAALAWAPTRWAYQSVRLVRGRLQGFEDRGGEGAERDAMQRAFFPRPFLDRYRREAEARVLPVALPLAISRQESLFDPEIRSWAGAVGLMQLMPATAAEEAARLGLRKPTDGDLTDPSLNVQLGIFHLSKLVERFGGMAPAIAAYNAGATRVEQWLRDRPLQGEGAVSEDLWVDTIPITQTRLYVKGVLRSFWEYRRLYPESESGGSPGAR